MIGQGVLRECLIDPDVESVLSIGRTATGRKHPKLRERIHRNFLDYSEIAAELAGFDACFFCLGVTSVGMEPWRYRVVTHDFTLAAANALANLNPGMTFIYVSGAGTDSAEKGRTHWARVKGETENALLRLPLKAYMFRPGAVVPMHGVQSKTALYRALYAGLAPVLRLLHLLLPKQVLTTEQIGRAMIEVAGRGADTKILESPDIAALAIRADAEGARRRAR
jgi:uncharacterized protein YbjT (DUF2867 family)